MVMEIDYKFIKSVLDEIKTLQNPYADSDILYKKYLGGDDDGKRRFIFHWHLIIENGLISTNKSPVFDLKSSGLISGPQNPLRFTLVSPPIRLTSLGIEFLQSLQEPKVLEVIVDKFKDEGFSVVLDISKQLGMKLLNKKLEGIDL
ncbi:hypothetical protein BCT19_07430 [Vibrio splendidus]|nr:hypothetical protein BCT19_07430 [Vibrio splendidus]